MNRDRTLLYVAALARSTGIGMSGVLVGLYAAELGLKAAGVGDGDANAPGEKESVNKAARTAMAGPRRRVEIERTESSWCARTGMDRTVGCPDGGMLAQR